MAENKASNQQPAKSGAGGQQGVQRQEGTGGLSQQGQRGYGSLSPFGFGGSPFSLMRRMFEDMDRFIENVGMQRGGFLPEFTQLGQRGNWSPQIEVFQREGQFVVRAELPGLTKDDVNVELIDDSLVIQGERKYEREEDKEGLYRSEFSYGSFFRTIPLPQGVSGDDVTANFNNGVLEVCLKAPEQKPKSRRIEVGEGTTGATKKSIH